MFMTSYMDVTAIEDTMGDVALVLVAVALLIPGLAGLIIGFKLIGFVIGLLDGVLGAVKGAFKIKV